MKNKTIKITSTSSLMARSKAWKILDKYACVKFSDYGTWPQDLLEDSADEILFLNLHIQDLIDDPGSLRYWKNTISSVKKLHS